MELNLRFPQGKTKALTLSYDDGVTTDIRMAKLMEQHGVKGTFNINTACFAEEEQEYPKGQWGRMTREQCQKLYDNPNVEVAVHARTHPHLEKLPGARVMQEVVQDREVIEEMFGKPCRGMAYPFGSHSDEVVDILRCAGIVYSRTTVSTENFDIPTDWLRMPATCHHNNPRLMELADRFLEPETRFLCGKLFYLWGHTYEFEKNDNWQVIEEFLAKVGGRSDVWYATNIEVYDYVQAYRQLIYSADMKLVQNNSATDVWIGIRDKEVRTYYIPAGSVVRIG